LINFKNYDLHLSNDDLLILNECKTAILGLAFSVLFQSNFG